MSGPIILGAVDPVRFRGHCRWVDSSTSRIAIGLVKSARKIIDATALFHRGARCSGGASGLVERGMPMQVIGYVSTITPEADAGLLNAFRQALRETGFVEGQNGAIEYRWTEYRVDRLPQFSQPISTTAAPMLWSPRHNGQLSRPSLPPRLFRRCLDQGRPGPIRRSCAVPSGLSPEFDGQPKSERRFNPSTKVSLLRRFLADEKNHFPQRLQRSQRCVNRDRD